MKFIIETQNLILRDFTNDDVHDYFAMDSLPIVHRYLGDNPLQSLEQATHIIEKVRNQYEQYGIGRWTVIEKSTGKYVGWSGLKFVTEIENNRSEYYDVGYRLHPDFWEKDMRLNRHKLL
jgi:ribosomal-protein-alanine N-acetyltransferase